MSIIAYVADLLFQSRIEGVARALAQDVRVCRDARSASATLSEAVAADRAAAVIVDMSADQGEPLELLRTARGLSPEIRCIAFVSHVRDDLMAAARDAGADEVLSRSAFAAQLPDLLRQLADAETR